MMSVHWVKADMGCERRDLILTSEYVRTSPRWGVVKSLALIGAEPVGLVHSKKFGIKYKEPPRLMLIGIQPSSAPAAPSCRLMTETDIPLPTGWRWRTTQTGS